MENLVRNAISNYNNYVAEALMYEKWIQTTKSSQLIEELKVLDLKVATINAWLNLLTFDEKFVIQKHLIEQIEWPRVAFEYRERWKSEFYRSERCLQLYQASAISKIVNFATKHEIITKRLFEDPFSNDTTHD